MSVRNTAKALIIINNKILLNKNQNTLGDFCWGLPNGAIYYDLPGGGQEKFETLEESVTREIFEETGCSVIVDRLSAICEEIVVRDEQSIGKNMSKIYERHCHKIHFVFTCRLKDEAAKPATVKDLDMLESEWVDVEQIANIPFFPKVIHDNFDLILGSESVVFLGSERI